MMLKTERQKDICRKYSARDKDGYVHCNDCPLVVDRKYHMCRSNSHYDRKLKEWVPDEEPYVMLDKAMAIIEKGGIE